MSRRTDRWQCKDRAEASVRGFLVNGRFFHNGFCNEYGIGKFLPPMTEAIPGQYNASGNGVDLYAVDGSGYLWVIEITRGNARDHQGRRSAIPLKGGGRGVARAGGAPQMSEGWILANTELFFAQMKDAHDKVRDLLNLPEGTSDAEAKDKFMKLLESSKVANSQEPRYRKAIIFLNQDQWGHFEDYRTDVDPIHDVYTFERSA